MTIQLSQNDHGTIFVELDGTLIADSSTFRRQRGFWNKLTQQWTEAPAFTPRKARANPAMVLELLAATGTTVAASVVWR